jgi:deazaflavin-dependent oxidoreductase (nitroreductase family)
MLRTVLIVVAALAAVVCSCMVLLVVAMRTKSPRLLGVVRRFNRDVANKLQRRSAGRPGAYASLIQHRGRTSGRLYDTPVVPFATQGGFLISLPYGSNTDWLKNVLAAGSAVVVTNGQVHTVDHPEVLTTAEARDGFPPKEQRTHRRFGVDQCLRLRIVSTAPATQPAPGP